MIKDSNISHGELRERITYDPKLGTFTWTDSKKNSPSVRSKPASSYSDKDGNSTIMLNYQSWSARQLAWFWMTGEIPVGQVRPKDGISSNCRFENLNYIPAKNGGEKYIVSKLNCDTPRFEVRTTKKYYGCKPTLEQAIVFRDSFPELCQKDKQSRSVRKLGVFKQKQIVSHGELIERLTYDSEHGVFTWTDSKKNKPSLRLQIAQPNENIGITIKGRTWSARQLAWYWVTGEIPKGRIIPLDGNSANLRFSNLEYIPYFSPEKYIVKTQIKDSILYGVRKSGKHYGNRATLEEAIALRDSIPALSQKRTMVNTEPVGELA